MVSVELILILAFLMVAAFVGVTLVRQQLFQARTLRALSGVLVRDASGDILGRPVSYDLCEAPELLCRDYGFTPANTATPGATAGLSALVGTRATHMVSRTRTYFVDGTGTCSGAACCTGTAYVPVPENLPAGSNLLPVGAFTCGLQVDSAGNRICYAVGPPSDWGAGCTDLATPCAGGGRLFRSDTTQAAVNLSGTAVYQWTSLFPDCEGLPSPDFEATAHCSQLASPPSGLYWRPAVEVVDSQGNNVLEASAKFNPDGSFVTVTYEPLFEVQQEPDLTVGTIPPTPEGAPGPGGPVDPTIPPTAEDN